MKDKHSDTFNYFAFISYSHGDMLFARKLHRKLETYNISSVLKEEKKRSKLYPICRDETAFSTGFLDEVIKEKLCESKKLIVLCSKKSAESKYVCEEIEYFADIYGMGNIIPVICEKYTDVEDGENDERVIAERKKEERKKMLPGILNCDEGELVDKGCKKELLDIDVNAYSYRYMFLKIVAGILDMEFEAFEKRDRQRLKKRIAVFSAISLFMVSVLVAVGLYGVRFFNKGIISREVSVAKQVSSEKLYDGLEMLLNAGDKAKKWHIDTEIIQDAVREVVNYDKGATLKIERFPVEQYNDSALLSNYGFIDKKKSLIYHRGKVIRVNDLKVILDTNGRKCVYHGDNGDVRFKVGKRDFLDVHYINDNEKFVFEGLEKEKEYFCVFDTVTGEVKKFSDKFDRCVYKGKYIYYAKNGEIFRFDTDKVETAYVSKGFPPFAVGENGKVYACEEKGKFRTDFDERTSGIYVSPDDKKLFVYEIGKLYAYDAEDMRLLYDFDLPKVHCDVEFFENNAVVYSSDTREHILYPDNMFYINFSLSDGNIISQRKISYEGDIEGLFEDSSSHLFDMSDDGKSLIYSMSDNKVVLEALENRELQIFDFDAEIINLAFYGGGACFKVFLSDGQVHTIAADASGSINNMRCSSMIADRDNMGNMIIAERNLLAKPVNYGKEYKVIFEGEGKVEILGQTKNYFVFCVRYMDADDEYYVCDKNTNQILEINEVVPDEDYLWDYENDAIYDLNSEKMFNLSAMGFLDEESSERKKRRLRWVCVNDESMVIISETGKERVNVKVNNSATPLRLIEGEDCFVAYNREIIAKYDMSGRNIFKKDISLMSNTDATNEKTVDSVISFDKMLSKVCYTDFDENAFLVIDMNTGKEIYRYDFTQELTTGFALSRDNYRENIAGFSNDGESVFFTYVDLAENVCKTQLIQLDNAKVLDAFLGYPIIFDDHFTDTIIINKSLKNVCELEKPDGYLYNSYTVAPVFRGYDDMKNKVYTLLDKMGG